MADGKAPKSQNWIATAAQVAEMGMSLLFYSHFLKKNSLENASVSSRLSPFHLPFLFPLSQGDSAQ